MLACDIFLRHFITILAFGLLIASRISKASINAADVSNENRSFLKFWRKKNEIAYNIA